VNAIYGAARIIFSLELMAESLNEDSFLGRGTLAVTHIENIERTKNVIPDCCTFNIDRRLTLGETEAHTLAEIQGLLAKEGVEGQVKVTEFNSVSYTGKPCQGKKSYPAWVTDEKDPLVKTVSKSAQTITGYKPRLGRWNFSTAGVYTMGYAGIPTVGFGPGEEHHAHTANERVALKDCFTAAVVYAQIAHDLLG
jgi:putative selenium metabolism hydrolase